MRIRGREVISDSVLASSVLPTPAGPSIRTGRPIRAARYTTVEMRRVAMYLASRKRCWTSSTDWNIPFSFDDVERRFIVAQWADTGVMTADARTYHRTRLRLGVLGFLVGAT